MTKTNVSGEDRAAVYANLFRVALKKLTPSCGSKLSGQQVAYAKGQAKKAFLAMGL